MKKRNLCWLALGMLILAANGCVEREYEAYVTIVNIGNLPMKVWMDGDQATIAAYDSETWAITLEEKNEQIEVLLEAEPLDHSDHDEIFVVLHGDRDIQTWLTGWDRVGGAGKPLKKKSQLLSGPAPK